MMRRPIAAFVAMLLVAAGCGGDDSSSDTTDTADTTADTTTPEPTTSTIAVPVDEAIAGTITFAGDVGDGVILVVVVEVGSNGPPAYGIDIDEAGAYVVTGVADGEYVVQAFLDSADDRGPPEADEPQGFYDANGDGTPDTIVIAGGVGVIGIDITLE